MKNLGKSIAWTRSQGVLKVLGHPYTGRNARSSLRQHNFLVVNTDRLLIDDLRYFIAMMTVILNTHTYKKCVSCNIMTMMIVVTIYRFTTLFEHVVAVSLWIWSLNITVSPTTYSIYLLKQLSVQNQRSLGYPLQLTCFVLEVDTWQYGCKVTQCRCDPEVVTVHLFTLATMVFVL